MKEYHGASWMVESGPAVMKKATSKAITTARASRFCVRPGDKLERKKCCSSGSTAAVFTIRATLRSGWNARHEAHTASTLSSQAASARRHFCLLGRLTTNKQASRPVKRLDWQDSCGGACNRASDRLENTFFGPPFRLSPVRMVTQRDISLSHLRDPCLHLRSDRLCPPKIVACEGLLGVDSVEKVCCSDA